LNNAIVADGPFYKLSKAPPEALALATTMATGLDGEQRMNM
jgi:hypothetical protein